MRHRDGNGHDQRNHRRAAERADYDVQVTALSVGGNESAASNLVTAAPVYVEDFWRLYKADAGREEGGCSTGTAGGAALFALLLLRRRWMRS